MGAVEPRVAIEVVTLFASEVRAALAMGVVGRALERGLARVATEDPRTLTTDVHGTVDDRSYGGGPGMVLKVEPLAGAIERAAARLPAGSPTILLSAQGRRFDQAAARRLAALPGFVLVAGRYEGVDERLVEELVDEELSIGDYVLSGGELAALVVIDAVVRLLPGVLGAAESAEQESFGESPGPLLDWPHYTRPEEWRGRRVPEVLRSGNHAAIRRWRLKEALGRTAERRPELLAGRELSNEEQRLLDEYRKEHEP
jgi:tRNA (guanine37-N1)-methyltransferase